MASIKVLVLLALVLTATAARAERYFCRTSGYEGRVTEIFESNLSFDEVRARFQPLCTRDDCACASDEHVGPYNSLEENFGFWVAHNYSRFAWSPPSPSKNVAALPQTSAKAEQPTSAVAGNAKQKTVSSEKKSYRNASNCLSYRQGKGTLVEDKVVNGCGFKVNYSYCWTGFVGAINCKQNQFGSWVLNARAQQSLSSANSAKGAGFSAPTGAKVWIAGCEYPGTPVNSRFSNGKIHFDGCQ